MPKNHHKKSGTHSAAASKSPKRRRSTHGSTKSSEASLASTTEEHSEDLAESRPSHPAPAQQQQPQQEQQPQHQQQPQHHQQPQHQQQPQHHQQPQQQQQQIQQVPMYYQAHTPMLPMQDGMQGRVFVDPNDPNTLHYEGFDPGARFSNLAPPRVPPPPPGVMPNPAQLALMQGRNVVVTQRKANVISGGSSGGVDTSCTLQ